MFDESFESYQARIKENFRYWIEDRKAYIIAMLREVLEILWAIGTMLSKDRK